MCVCVCVYIHIYTCTQYNLYFLVESSFYFRYLLSNARSNEFGSPKRLDSDYRVPTELLTSQFARPTTYRMPTHYIYIHIHIYTYIYILSHNRAPLKRNRALRLLAGSDAVVLVHPTCGPTQEEDIPGSVRHKTYVVLQDETKVCYSMSFIVSHSIVYGRK